MTTRIVALADSLALPRNEDGEILLWEETWPRCLESALRARGDDVEVINCGGRARTSSMLELTEHVFYKRPDVVVLQIGIVDCAPRIISKREKALLNLPFVPVRLRKQVIERRKAHRREITKKDPLARVYTTPEEYGANLEEFFAEVAALEWPVAVFVLPILANPDVMEAKSPGHTGNVQLYNRVLAAACESSKVEMIDAKSIIADPHSPGMFSRDGFHLGVEGSRRVAEVLAERIAPARNVNVAPILGHSRKR